MPFPAGPLVLWAGAHRGPETVAISHESALAVLEISGAKPSRVHLSVQRSARMRREIPKAVELHRTAIDHAEIAVVDGIPFISNNEAQRPRLRVQQPIDLLRAAEEVPSQP